MRPRGAILLLVGLLPLAALWFFADSPVADSVAPTPQAAPPPITTRALNPTCTVIVHVTDPEGAPLERARAWIAGEAKGNGGQTDPFGEVTLEDPDCSATQVGASSPWADMVEEPLAGRTEVELTMTPMRQIPLRIRASDGNPPASVNIGWKGSYMVWPQQLHDGMVEVPVDPIRGTSLGIKAPGYDPVSLDLDPEAEDAGEVVLQASEQNQPWVGHGEGGALTVVGLSEKSEAWAAGLRKGDVITDVRLFGFPIPERLLSRARIGLDDVDTVAEWLPVEVGIRRDEERLALPW